MARGTTETRTLFQRYLTEKNLGAFLTKTIRIAAISPKFHKKLENLCSIHDYYKLSERA